MTTASRPRDPVAALRDGPVPGPEPDMPWRLAQRTAWSAGTPTRTQEVPLTPDAVGRTLAAAVTARSPLPAADTSAMDGFAVAGPGPWRIVGRVLAGEPPYSAIANGTAVEVMTGAVVPVGAVVIPYEQCRRDGYVVDAVVGAKDHIRRTGEDARSGEQLLPAGKVLTAASVGLLAQAGLDSVVVFRPARVRIVVTGDEVVSAGRPALGQVRDALGPLVEALVVDAGGVVDGRQYLADEADELAAQLQTDDDVDVLVVTGSSSRGAADHLRPVLHRDGVRILVDGVACRPGHPQLLAALSGGRWVVGVPGNPFAGVVACLTLLRPLLYGLAGRPQPVPIRLPLIGTVTPIPGVTRLVPVTARAGSAVVVPSTGSASLRAAAIADALAVVDADWTPGAPADLIFLP